STITAGPLLLDLNRKHAALAEQPFALTAYEYRILEYLMLHHQQVVPKERLIEQMCQYDDELETNVIEGMVSSLRRTIE
ncbi:winged helix-turn-helix domain-containing protein, partial [Pseudomonas syringae pv. tagetis]|uniref:winged helix-turn-helix domain-containing protein n=1 Tax=Pseudomonas syringae group genomosp. 7 TaxID=251699 RepID=UPI0037704C70